MGKSRLGLTRSSDEKGMLERAASLTDEEVERVVESNFGGEMFQDLRSFLLDALKVNPADRWDVLFSSLLIQSFVKLRQLLVLEGLNRR